ncbi:oligopeptide/dipeptide ABC transporter ATP-binding protein [Priestia megaterium]|uniref:oligopeptide/dipeptide ABC transporter ATP-binding protein n=1 Tax=Priestia megaterium TaxID=1404 RepID=UPI002A6AC8B6|nr:oligopeptide/dipeptide ABC transporter ATP-binding protein [Priestia megaterium]MDY0939666.1 oligopeptide/dipeptide ABC transporter ATP-binding protein [Priestia megaterium]
MFLNTRHPYTKLLLSSVPAINEYEKREKIEVKGEIPSPLNPPSGYAFYKRCPFAFDRCMKETPEDTVIDSKHKVKCHLYS